MRTSNRFYFDREHHNIILDKMGSETDQQADAIADEAERVQRVKPKTILRKKTTVKDDLEAELNYQINHQTKIT